MDTNDRNEDIAHFALLFSRSPFSFLFWIRTTIKKNAKERPRKEEKKKEREKMKNIDLLVFPSLSLARAFYDAESTNVDDSDHRWINDTDRFVGSMTRKQRLRPVNLSRWFIDFSPHSLCKWKVNTLSNSRISSDYLRYANLIRRHL